MSPAAPPAREHFLRKIGLLHVISYQRSARLKACARSSVRRKNESASGCHGGAVEEDANLEDANLMENGLVRCTSYMRLSAIRDTDYSSQLKLDTAQ